MRGDIQIAKSKLNIKYGINGTGKTTISKAIASANDENGLQVLRSYSSEEKAYVSVLPQLHNILVFDEEFVNNVVFREDEVIENSFEVFLKTKDYDIRKQKIDNRLHTIHNMMEQDTEIQELQKLIEKVAVKFSRSKTGKLNKKGTYKSILTKQNLYNIPKELEEYSCFFQNTDINVQWIDWKNKGDSYDIGDRCPYCSENLDKIRHDKKKKIFQDNYTKTDSQNLKDILELFDNLKEYMLLEKYEELVSYIKRETAEDVIEAIMSKLIIEIDLIINRLHDIQEFGKKKIAVADISRLENQISQMVFPIHMFEILGGKKTKEVLEKINTKIKELQDEANVLKVEMGELKGVMQATIRDSQKDINDFLKTAGINYELVIETEDEENSKTILRQCFSDEKTNVTQIRQHLSWGEKNAFALILFIYYAHAKSPDLIILDDPISSFDSNKKFAILHRMFKNFGRNKVSLDGETVLLLTHDFEPITDFLVVGKLGEEKANAMFVWNQQGELKEKDIDPHKDVKIIYDECALISRNTTYNMVTRVAFLRKLCELNGKENTWDCAYEILSCLIHGGDIKRKISEKCYRDMTPDEVQAGMEKIKEFIPDFEYQYIRETYYTLKGIKELYLKEENAYFKLQLFRTLKYILGDDKIKISSMDKAWYKFIDETYHIENDYLHYLDITKFNVVPSYILNIVDDMFEKTIKLYQYL